MSRAEDERTAGAAARRRADPSPRPATPSPEPLTAEEEAKFRESVRLLAGAEAQSDWHALQWSNEAAARLLATLDAARSLPSAPDHRLRDQIAETFHKQLCTVSHHDKPEVYRAAMGRNQPCRDKFVSIAALALSEATPDPALDVERRLYVLAKLVGIAHDEMPERLNNRTRVNVNHAAAVADPLRGHSCGECNDLLADYDRQSTCVYCSGPDRAGLCFGGDKCMRLAASQPPEPDIQ